MNLQGHPEIHVIGEKLLRSPNPKKDEPFAQVAEMRATLDQLVETSRPSSKPRPT